MRNPMFIIIMGVIFLAVVGIIASTPRAMQPPPKQPAIIIKMDYETVKRIDTRLDEIDRVLTINGLIPAK